MDNKNKHYALGLTCLFLIIGAFTASHHEMWRDEIQAWLLARDSTSVFNLFVNLKYEEHPGLWHLCLIPLSRITHSPVIMQMFHLLTPLREGYDMVIGNRFKGNMSPAAMPWPNRYIGNPILSGLLRFLFRTQISDSHCGMRSFTKAAYTRMALQTTGMEFASEMVVRAVQEKLKIREIPIDYAPRVGESKLNPVRDAWRHIRFLLKERMKRKS